jgi:hypothetical protein
MTKSRVETQRWCQKSAHGKKLEDLFKTNKIAPGAAASKIRKLFAEDFGEYSVSTFRGAFNRTKQKLGIAVGSKAKKGTVDCFFACTSFATLSEKNSVHRVVHVVTW